MQTIVFGALLVSLVAAIAVIDMRSLRIPDGLNLVLAALGIANHLSAGDRLLAPYLAGAASMLSAMLLIRRVHFNRTGRVGLGLGDVKMAAAGAVWIEPLTLPLFIVIASSSALAFALSGQAVAHPPSLDRRIPFGPFLGIGLVATWLFVIYSESGTI